jgi:hydrogenase/urease accessory protein HupE
LSRRSAGHRPMRGLLLVIAAVLAGVAPRPACAHDQSFSHADVEWARDRISVVLTVHRDDAASVLGTISPETLMDRAVLNETARRLAEVLAARFRLEGDGDDLALRFQGAEAKPREHAVSLSFRTGTLDRPVTRLKIECGLLPAIADHETFLKVTQGRRLALQDVLTKDHARVEAYSDGPVGALAVFATFLRAGIHHIFIGPDHILFIVGLLLLGGGLARVLKVATAFTLAHSITLAVAALGWVTAPGWLVEPLIALSIVVVGVENIRSRPERRDWRTRAAFCFGLVHGFGFASVLHEVGLPRHAIGWSLLAFNLGVELGQAAIVMVVTPLVAALRAHWPCVAPRAVAACSWAIIAAGTFWFVERMIEPALRLTSRL